LARRRELPLEDAWTEEIVRIRRILEIEIIGGVVRARAGIEVGAGVPVDVNIAGMMNDRHMCDQAMVMLRGLVSLRRRDERGDERQRQQGTDQASRRATHENLLCGER
jgi:hypothetical protein